MLTDFQERTLRAELRRHARALARLAADLEQSEDFPNNTARDFCTIICKSAEMIGERVEHAPRDRLGHIHFLLATFGKDLRYAERSRMEQTPWSLIEATETLLQKHVGENYRFIIRPQWSYNYAIIGDRLGHYRQLFSALSDWIPLPDWENRMSRFCGKQIFSISFPRVEKMNVLTHANWGHEVGHILASEWIRVHFNDFWDAAADEIEPEMRRHVTEELPEPFRVNFVVDTQVAKRMNDTMAIVRVGIQELVSDAVGAHLFGPAALASLAEFSCRFNLDASPLDCGDYPPWRYRLRRIADIVVPPFRANPHIQANRHLNAYATWIGRWHDVVASDKDTSVLDNDVRTRLAYHLLDAHWNQIWNDIIAELPEDVQKPYAAYERSAELGELIERVDQGVPPNETGTWPDTTPAEMADIWNAAWACKAHRFADDSGPSLDEYLDTLFQLTLKAVESSYVHRTFAPRIT